MSSPSPEPKQGRERGPNVVYNKGGFVAHIAVKIGTTDAFEAFKQASEKAHKIDGVVQRMYDDTRSRHGVGAAEQGGVTITLGTMEDVFES